ncbi:uncharacterized protein LOC126907332 isoform X1 [Daktulosphaira vitifoliae]|uniref:uncharacterized protein LOC126907332 isoform X1 n=1 Tax=Daktulosphaira vitifoliae TaxID=58002 RepID=UPI0021AAF4F6|nr:uncharacterized protein LOC126907332 isoform X1 [Daktulosphaira vitifoliae]
MRISSLQYVWLASHKTCRILDSTIQFLIFICTATPVVSEVSIVSHFTNVPIISLTSKQCGQVLFSDEHLFNDISTPLPLQGMESLQKDDEINVLRRVQTELKRARMHYKRNVDLAENLYLPVKSEMKTDYILRTNVYQYEWLPFSPMLWYDKYVKQLDKETKLFMLLPMLRDSLHNFSVTLDQMRKFNETNSTFDYKTRKSLIDDLYKHLIAVLCEVETALVNIGSWRNWKIPESAQSVLLGGKGWDPSPDHTAMLIQDWGVLTTYYRFLKESLNISHEIVHGRPRASSFPSSTPKFRHRKKQSASTPSNFRSTTHHRRRHSSSVPTTTGKSDLTTPWPCLRHSVCGTQHKRRRRRHVQYSTVM